MGGRSAADLAHCRHAGGGFSSLRDGKRREACCGEERRRSVSYPYFRMYPGDYRRDTSHLTLAEHGAYALLLCQYYATGKPLPADQQSLCRICSAQTPEEIAAVRTVADAFFAPNGDGLRHNKRADRELSDLAELSATNVERARKAAVRSWEVRRGSSQAYAPSNAPSSATSIRQAMLEQCQPEPEPEPRRR